MRIIICAFSIFLLSSCTAIQSQNKQQLADQAKAEALQVGHSGPLYDHYEACLNQNWQAALEANADAVSAYATGQQQCTYELTLLCDYYQVESCYADAEASNLLLFLLLRERYAAELMR